MISNKKSYNKLMENIHKTDHIYPKIIPVISLKEKLKNSVLHLYVPNQQTQTI